MVLTASLLLHFGSSHAASLLVADAIIFNMLYLSDSLSVGVMQNHVLPQGSIFADMNHVTLYNTVGAHGIGRFLGPWMARILQEQGGVAMYTASQIVCSCVYCITFETLMFPSQMSNHKPHSHSKGEMTDANPNNAVLSDSVIKSCK